MTDLYLWMLDRPGLTGIYNAGFENLQIKEIARMVAEKTGSKVEPKPSNDPRSYRINSDKLLSTGFKPKHCVPDAIDQLIAKVKAGELSDEPQWYNLKTMPA